MIAAALRKLDEMQLRRGISRNTEADPRTASREQNFNSAESIAFWLLICLGLFLMSKHADSTISTIATTGIIVAFSMTKKQELIDTSNHFASSLSEYYVPLTKSSINSAIKMSIEYFNNLSRIEQNKFLKNADEVVKRTSLE
jgi:hypothetical protein